MIAEISHHGRHYRIALNDPIDLSLPLDANAPGPRAWHVEAPRMEPVRYGDKVFAVTSGSPVNFRNVFFNPHGNGTHTECVGHISKENYSINKTFSRFMFIAELVTILPEELPNGDFVITKKQLINALKETENIEAIVIRTLSNGLNKLHMQYSNTSHSPNCLKPD